MGVGLARLDLIASAAIGDKISGSDTPASGALLLTTAQGFPFQWNERQTTKKPCKQRNIHEKYSECFTAGPNIASKFCDNFFEPSVMNAKFQNIIGTTNY
jgi:hypothetical protein